MNITQPISGSRLPLLNRQGDTDVAIRNIGGNIVYLDDTTDVNVSSFPLYPGDVATWQRGKPCYAVCASGQTSTVVMSDSLASTLGLGNVSATLAAGTQVGIAGTVAVDGSGHTQPVDGSGHTQPVTGSVGVNGASAGTPSSGPSFASRDVSASSTASATTTSSGTVVTLIPATPGVSLELHGLQITTRITNWFGSVQILRSDTGAVVFDVSVANGLTTIAAVVTTYDFLGTTLPVGVGLNIQNLSGGSTSSGTNPVTKANLAYNTVT